MRTGSFKHDASPWHRRTAPSVSSTGTSLPRRPDLPHTVVAGRLHFEVMHPIAESDATGREVEEEDLSVVQAHLLNLVIHLLPFGRIRLDLGGGGELGDLRVLVPGP